MIFYFRLDDAIQILAYVGSMRGKSFEQRANPELDHEKVGCKLLNDWNVSIYNWWGKMKLLKSVIFMLNYFLKAILLFIWSDVSNYGVYNISPLVSYIKSFCLPLFWDSTLPLYEHNCLQLLICYFLNLTLIGNEINK